MGSSTPREYLTEREVERLIKAASVTGGLNSVLDDLMRRRVAVIAIPGSPRIEIQHSAGQYYLAWLGPEGRMSVSKHPESNCECGPKAASPLALRWRCSVCGTSAIMKMSILAAVCDGEGIRKADPQGDRE